jgi:hypothetical protein
MSETGGVLTGPSLIFSFSLLESELRLLPVQPRMKGLEPYVNWSLMLNGEGRFYAE